MLRVITCFCTLLVLQFRLLPAQDYRIENITSEYIRIEKGLSQNTVNCLLQDREGYIWAGTWSGLNRFDGYTFRSIATNMVNPKLGLTNATIVSIAEDSLGYIWAGCVKGLNRISKSDLSITQFTTESSGKAGMVSDSINALYKSRQGLIWIGTNQGIIILNPETLSFRHIEHNPRDFTTISSNQITCFAEDTAGSMWVGTRQGLNKMNPETGQTIRFYAGGEGELRSAVITALHVDSKGHLWIGTDNGLQGYKPLSRSFSWHTPSPASNKTTTSGNRINCLYSDKDDNLWIGTLEKGLYVFDPIRLKFNNMQEIIPETGYINSTTFSSIIQDRNGLFWLGTAHRGLIKMVPDPHAFYEIVKSYSTFGIVEPNPGTLWFGTQEGVMVWNRENKTSRFISHDDNVLNSISNNQISDLFSDPPYVWIGTRFGLNRFNTETNGNKAFMPDNTRNSIAGAIIWDIIKDSRGYYWFATNQGLSRYDNNTGTFTNYFHDPENPNTLSNNYCLGIFEVNPGNFLVATQYGLNEFNEETGMWKNHLPVPGNATTVSISYIFGIFRDSQGVIWVSTNGGGFCSFDPASGTFERYTTADGLCDDVVYGIYEDHDGIFWITTNNGLSRFDHRNDEFTNFDVQDGLLSNEFNKNSICEGADGEVFLGGVNGVIAFFPQTTLRTSKVPETRITGITVHGARATYQIPVSDTIRIPSTDNTFSVTFSVMDYLNPFKNQFSCFLENSDKSKIQLPPGQHQVDYRNVVPGHYNLKITGTNSLGVRSPELVATIIIVPAWYQTSLFQILTALTAILILATIIFLRINSLRNKHEMEKRLLTTTNELIRSQKFALRSQMNPHFIFNSLNSIQNFVLKNDVDSANYYLSNFSSLMRKVLEYSQYNYITLYEELEMIRLYLKMEHMRFSKKFDLDIRVDNSIDQNMVRIPPMLLQPYLENAILHGLQLTKHKGLLEVIITDHTDYMQIRIADNGIGRERARAIRERSGHKSRGLANIEKRIRLYNSITNKPLAVNITDIFDEKGDAAGTRVDITVPYEMEEHAQEIL